MTIIAGVAAGDMCWVLAGRRDTVVAGTASADHLSVIDRHHRRKNIGCVAVLTDVRRLNVCRVLAGRVGAIVAADAVAGDIHVIEIRR